MDWQYILDTIGSRITPFLGQGKVADYIPALKQSDPHAFAMSVITLNDGAFHTGDAHTPFSIQSISKVFTLTMALEFEGQALWDRVGREPSGSPFNSIVQLEDDHGIPRNPFINAGALVVTDAICTHGDRTRARHDILDWVRAVSDNEMIGIDEEVALSEKEWGDRNRALAYFMKSYGILRNNAEDVLDTYFAQCAIGMTCADLARCGLYLAAEGHDPIASRQITTHDRVNRLNALMMTCGHYDMSGDFAFSVGLPGKSGVGGGILAIVPGVCSVAVWSPALNRAGNSLAGTKALEMFSDLTELNLF